MNASYPDLPPPPSRSNPSLVTMATGNHPRHQACHWCHNPPEQLTEHFPTQPLVSSRAQFRTQFTNVRTTPTASLVSADLGPATPRTSPNNEHGRRWLKRKQPEPRGFLLLLCGGRWWLSLDGVADRFELADEFARSS